MDLAGEHMEKLVLQIVGGGLYLANKVFLNLMERSRGKSFGQRFWRFKQLAWLVYLIGLIPIATIFIKEKDWIFAIIEIGGAPAMLCGLIAARKRKSAPKWLERISFLAIPIGLGYSMYYYAGINTFNQALQIGGASGFLIGTYLLSKDRAHGYLWFLLMHVSTAWLLYRQGYPLFVPQQALSVLVVLDARRVRKLRLAI